MIQKIGERELALRKQREDAAKEHEAKTQRRKPAVSDLAAKLPKTSGVKPVKRKMKRKAKKQPGVSKPKKGEPTFEV